MLSGKAVELEKQFLTLLWNQLQFYKLIFQNTFYNTIFLNFKDTQGSKILIEVLKHKIIQF